MRINNCVLALGSLFALAIPLAGCGCGDNSMTQAEIDKGKHSKPPTQEQLQMWYKGAADAASKGRQEELAWAKAHPDKVAEVNAARAAGGKPPLGQ